MDSNTHLGINAALCGTPVTLSAGKAVAELTTTQAMAADDHGLVHGGFVFGLADYAAMLAINDPNVVLGAAQTRFLKPVRAGQKVVATACCTEVKGKKHTVEVSVQCAGIDVMNGTFTCFVLDQHVLSSDSE